MTMQTCMAVKSPQAACSGHSLSPLGRCQLFVWCCSDADRGTDPTEKAASPKSASLARLASLAASSHSYPNSYAIRMEVAGVEVRFTKSWGCFSQFVPVVEIIWWQCDLSWQTAWLRHQREGGGKADVKPPLFSSTRLCTLLHVPASSNELLALSASAVIQKGAWVHLERISCWEKGWACSFLPFPYP